MKGLIDIDLTKLGLKNVRKGKVRTLGEFGDKFIAVTTDRLSAFNVVSTQAVPFKGQCLNAQSRYFFNECENIIKPWAGTISHPLLLIGEKLEIIPFEFIYRAILTGSLADDYARGERGEVYGIKLPDNLKRNHFFEKPIFTPTRKSEFDEKISVDTMFEEAKSGKIQGKRIISPIIKEAIDVGFALFYRIQNLLNDKNLILADCKLEFGISSDSRLMWADEAPTGDSARFFDRAEFEEAVAEGREPVQLSKEYLRQILKKMGWTGGTPVMPIFSEEEISETSKRYLELTKLIRGKPVSKLDYDINQEEVIVSIISDYLGCIR
ncbi:MAG: phosphoribosylaminoimidazolesuccinocarboxamide synthase [Deltaproteobacteria bacterium]|nr:phosphoribosylaminoimidazolesuccinocarboxamide synthase [Deltaproteobacteria bacterium]